MNNRINFQRIFTISTIVSLVLIYGVFCLQMINTKSERDGADFMGLYSASKISKHSGYPEIYDAEKQITVQSGIVGFQFPRDQTSYFTHPPFIILLVSLVSDSDYIYSLIHWSLLLILLNIFITFILIKSLTEYKFEKREYWTLGFGIFLFWPTFSGFINGQDVLILLLGTSMWMLYFLRRQYTTAGVWLGLSAIRPQMAIFLSLPFLLRKQKVFWGFAFATAILALISLILIGISGLHKYITLLGIVEGDLWRLPHTKDMPTISGFITRNFDKINKDVFHHTIFGGYITAMLLSSFWWQKNTAITEKHIGILIITGLIFVPYAHYHELALLLIPIFCLIRIFSTKELVSKEILCLYPLFISVLLIFGFIGGGALKYITVYLVMAFLGFFLFFPEKIIYFRSFLYIKQFGK